jgi:hypothetical protein
MIFKLMQIQSSLPRMLGGNSKYKVQETLTKIVSSLWKIYGALQREQEKYIVCPLCGSRVASSMAIGVGRKKVSGFGGSTEEHDVLMCIHCAQYSDVVRRFAPIPAEEPIPMLGVEKNARENSIAG